MKKGTGSLITCTLKLEQVLTVQTDTLMIVGGLKFASKMYSAKVEGRFSEDRCAACYLMYALMCSNFRRY